MINYIALVTALMLSGVSAYYSVYGLTTLFAAAFFPVLFMGGALEIGKLVSVSWLYNNWNIAPRYLKFYLSAAVIILMLINSMGIYGFLAKAHIDQSVNLNTGVVDEVKIIETNLAFEKQSLEDIDKQINQIDNALTKMTDKGQASGSLKAADQQRKTRDSLVKKKEEIVKNVSSITRDKIKKESEVKKLETEVGPIKYIAELIYGTTESNQLEKAVRMVIIIIVMVFDPLAIMLLIAANIGLTTKKSLTKTTPKSILVVDDKVFRKDE